MRRVVITGVGAVTPIGNNVKDFWANLTAGKNGIDYIKSFDSANINVKVAGEIKDFDPIALGLDKSTARRSDKFVQYALIAAKEAMEDSKIEISPERLGVYVGTGVGGLNVFIEETKKYLTEGPKWVSPLFVPMFIPNMASSNIAITYNAQGPSVPVTAACTTGSMAIGEAYKAIAAGFADAIIAGGTEAGATELGIASFASCKALSCSDKIDEASLPFDKRRAGFVLSDGAGIVVLEEYEHAKARNAKIYGEICGYGISSDAHHITAPVADGSIAARAISQAIQQAQISENDVVYINAHGTGTHMNDVAETKAIKLALGEERAHKAHISSNKSMIGHLLGAAGAVELIATALTLQNKIIPPTINLLEQDPECDLNYTPNVAVKADITLGLSNSFGFGGHNACIAVRNI